MPAWYRSVVSLQTSLSAIRTRFHPPSDEVRGSADETTRACRHQVDEQNEDHAVDRAGQRLVEKLGEVRNEHDEGAADQRARQPPDAADDEADEERDRQREGEAV